MPLATSELVERLIATSSNALMAFLVRRVRVRSDAADLAQEVYLRMLRLRDTGAIRDPEAYLFAVAANLASKYSALNRRFAMRVDLENPTGEEQLALWPDIDAQLDRDQRLERLREVMRHMPPETLAAVVHAYVEGLSYEQIAQRLGISKRMVKKHMSQALALCRRRMSRLKVDK